MSRKKIFQGFLALFFFGIFSLPLHVHALNFGDLLDKTINTLNHATQVLGSTIRGPSSNPDQETSAPQEAKAAKSSSGSWWDKIFGGMENSYEKTLGEQGHESLKKSPGLYKNQAMLNRLGNVARRLVPVCERKDLTYHFSVLDSDEVNAFALPGGYVYVTRGLMNAIGSDDELAGVVAHELAHVNKKHGIRQAEKAGLITLAVSLMGTKDETKKYQSAAAIAAYFANLKFSRNDEYEADRIAVDYSYKAGYNPNGLIYFFNRINKDNGLTKITKYFSTHPPTNDRIKQAKEEIARVSGSKSSSTAEIPKNTSVSKVTPEISQPPKTQYTAKPTADQLRAAYERYQFAKTQYEYKVSQRAPVEEIMAALKEYQDSKEQYLRLRAAFGN